jgi:gluconate 2-dehydrogenase gamma chain
VAHSRRVFLQTLASAGLGALAVGGCHRRLSLEGNRETGPAFFTAAEYATMAAACERILPHDDEDPGAIDLGVPHYVDLALAHDDYLHMAERFRQRVQELNGDALTRMGKPFHQLKPDDQDDVLETWESGTPDQEEFFRVLMLLTLEGAFGDPSYGGNKDERGWRLIGFAPGEPMPEMHHH